MIISVVKRCFMKLEFVIYRNGEAINTYNGNPIDLSNELEVKRFEKKNSVKLFNRIIRNNLVYKYSVKAHDDTAILSVYEGKWNDCCMKWSVVYSAKATYGVKGIVEDGDGDISFWHEFFATEYGYATYDESNIDKFSFDNDSMENVRKAFSFNMQTNSFLFFDKYAKMKKVKCKRFDKSIFNIPSVKINRNVGKVFNKQSINYAIQREVELANEVFFDITVISGFVTNGMMDIEKK